MNTFLSVNWFVIFMLFFAVILCVDLAIDLNAWKTHHLWTERRRFIAVIHGVSPLPLSLSEMVSDFCFHCDVLVTTKKNKLVGIYPDSARLHTVAEFSKSLTDLAVANGNIHRVYVLMCLEMQKTAIDCRDRLGCDGGDDDDAEDGEEGTANGRGDGDAANALNGNAPGGGTWTSIPSWIWEPKQVGFESARSLSLFVALRRSDFV